MDKITELIREISDYFKQKVNNQSSFILTIDISISQGTIRGWKLFKKLKA